MGVIFSYMTILKILATMVGGVIVAGFILTLLVLFWWIILPIMVFALGAALLNWGLGR
jgi:hypothetical protein